MPSETLVFVTGKLQKYTALSITVLGRKRLRCRIFQELKEVSISKWEKDTVFYGEKAWEQGSKARRDLDSLQQPW